MIYLRTTLYASVFVTSVASTNFYKTQTTTTGAPSESVAFYKQRGSSVLAGSNVGAASTFVYYTSATGGVQSVTRTSTLQTPDSASAGYGADSTFGGDHVTGNMLFVSEIDSGAVNNGKVVFYNGQYSSWSVQQLLRPPAEYYEQGFFGSSMDIDRYHLHTLAVGCKGCNSSHALGGSLYIYEATTPAAKKWTQMAELGTTSLNSMGAANTEIDRDVVVADAVDDSSVSHAVVFARDPKNKQWSLRQILTPRSTTGTALSASSMDVYDETIVVGTGGDSSFSSDHGSVSIFYADTGRFHMISPDPKAKPAPTMWSLRQVLYAPTATASNKFGWKVSIDGDRMAVSDGGGASNYFYIYEREWAWTDSVSQFQNTRSYAMWSFQQRLANTVLITDMQLRGSSLAVVDGTNLNIYDETRHWDCLLVSVEDHFSDGWDTANLIVETPTGDKDTFAHRCDMANPYQFRYCPADAGDEGLYRFSVPGGNHAKFHWELLWRVFDEASATWYTGNWDTKLDFEWSAGHKKFIPHKVERDLPNNITCKACKSRPTEKPSTRLRQLKSKDNTFAPTVSPAPTIVTSVDIHPWQELRLVSAGAVDWFDSQHKGTSYYISDKTGHRLLSVGTMCPWETTLSYKTCWEDYPDGEYVLRVGGGLDHVSSHTYQFCNSMNTLPAQSQMIFRVSNGECSILSFATSSTYCQNSLGIMQAAVVEISILGVKNMDGTSLSSFERSTVERGVAGLVEANVKDVHVLSAQVLGDTLNVEVEFAVMGSEKNLDFMDPEAVEAYEQHLISSLSSKSNELWAAIVSSDTYTPLQTSTGLHINNVHLSGSYEALVDRSNSIPLNNMVQDVSDSESKHNHHAQIAHQTDWLFSAGVAGWAVAALAALVVVVYTAFPNTFSATTNETPEENVVDAPITIEEETHSPILDTTMKPLEVEPPATSSSREKSVQSTLTLDDLYELVSAEDASLKAMLERCT